MYTSTAQFFNDYDKREFGPVDEIECEATWAVAAARDIFEGQASFEAVATLAGSMLLALRADEGGAS